MNRVMVIGNAGGGKSTLSRAVCAVKGLPYFSIDQILWQPNWRRTPDHEFERRHNEMLSHRYWVIDGYGPMTSVQARLSACDTVIFIDHPLHVHFWWAAKRQLKSIFVGRSDGPDGCPMSRVTFRVFQMIWVLHWQTRPLLIGKIYSQANRVKIIHIQSPSELNSFVRRLAEAA